MATSPAEANMLAAQPVVAPLQGQEVIPDDTGNIDLFDRKPIALGYKIKLSPRGKEK
jgi:hypothetical protein